MPRPDPGPLGRLVAALRPVPLSAEQKRRLFRQQVERLLPFFRAITFIGAPLVVAFLGWDYALGGREAVMAALPWRAGLSAAILLAWGASFHPVVARGWPLLWIALAVIVNVVVAKVSSQIAGGFAFGATGLLYALASNVVLAPSLGFALVSYLVIAGSSLVAFAAFGASGPPLVSAGWFLVTFGILFAIVATSAEQSRRRGLHLADRLREERERVDTLMAEMLPDRVARRLTAGDTMVADEVPVASVAFIDVVGYTGLVRQLPPARLVEFLKGAFAELDAIAARHGLTKIKTNGDSYMAAAGVAESEGRGAVEAVAFAREAIVALGRFGDRIGAPVGGHAGVATGPIVAGVIGETRPQYDLWGQTVNNAARLQAAAAEDELLVDAVTAYAVWGRFACTPRGPTAFRGIGTIEVWRVEGPLDPRRAP